MTLQKINNLNTNQNLRLSVQISLTGLSFLITSAQKEVVYFLDKKFTFSRSPEEVLTEIEYCFLNDKSLQQNFKNIKLVFANTLATLVPQELFEPSKASEYLKFNTKILQTDTFHHDTVEGTSIENVYIPFVNINNYFFEKFGPFEFEHSTTLLSGYFLNIEKYKIGITAYVFVEKNFYSLFIIKNGKLQFYNSFEYQSPEDYLYYLLFTFEQLQLSTEKTPIILCGEVLDGDAIFNISYKYIKEVLFLKNTFPRLNDEEHQNLLLKLCL